jgi:hypothetical protein
MFELNLNNVITLTFRLFPIILPSYFVLSSVFSQDIKGLIFLAGLLMTCFIVVLTGGSLANTSWLDTLVPKDVSCSQITLNGVSGGLSKIPLSTAVYSYSFFYLLYIIVTYKLASQNVPTILFFIGLIIADIGWNFSNHCSSSIGIFVSFGVAALCGISWAMLIDRSKAVNLQYYNGLSNKQTCSQPNKTSFKCTSSR